MDFSKILEITDQHKKIIKQYQKIYNFIFKYFLYLLILVISIFFTINIAFKNVVTIYKEPAMFVMKRVELKGKFQKFLKENTIKENINIYVLQGILNNSGNNLESVDNLFECKGFIMPKYVKIYKTAPLKSIGYFSGGNYDILELQNFVENIVFTEPIKLENTFKRAQIPLEKDIITTFNLSCLLEGNFLYGSCNFYIENFLKNFYVYNLKNNYIGMKLVYDKIQKRSNYKKEFCNGIENYVLYSNDTDPQLEGLFDSCGKSDYFSILKNFISVQSQFKDFYISDNNYYYDVINEYKLLSLQQILYNDIKNNIFNEKTILIYIGFVENLLKRDLLNGFYKDETYRFNTYFLKPKLSSSVYNNQKQQINSIIDEINIINKGSKLIGFTGLSLQVKNKNLVNQKNNIYTDFSNNSLDIQILVKQIENYSFLHILKETIKSENVYLNGYITILNKGQKLDLNFSTELSLYKNSLIVSKIIFKDYPQLGVAVASMIQHKNITLSEMYQYIKDNISLYMTDNSTVGFCDQVGEALPGMNILKCSTKNIKFIKKLSKENITYNVNIDNYTFKDISITNKNIEQQAISLLSGANTSILNFFTQLNYIAKLEPTKDISSDNYISEDSLIVLDKFKKYLGISPDNITENKGKFIVLFKLKNIEFICTYNLQTSTIETLTFNKINIDKNTKLSLDKFNLILNNDNKININYFTTKPIEYIQTIDYSIYKKYIEYK